MSSNLARFIATFFCVGYIPIAPGTCASLVGMFFYLLFYQNMVVYVAIFVVVLFFGFLMSDLAEQSLGEKDPSCIVIDEDAGSMITFFMLPLTPSVMITAFFLFRAFDMFKIYPVNKLEDLKGGVGVMMDDVIAGVYANLLMHAALKLKDLLFI